MVRLFEQDIRTIGRQSSKGNQLKWENNGTWYKADYTGYEGLSEYVISLLLCDSSLNKQEFVVYRPVEISYRSTIYKGAESRNFLHDDWQIITLEHLFRSFFNESLYDAVFKIRDHTERLRFIVSQVERITGLHEFGKYMNKILTIDAFFLNEDRHTHNIAVLMNGKGKFDYCPVFDNGAGLLADITMDYPLNGDIYRMMNEVRSKTFSEDFPEQLEISEKLYGNNITFSFSRQKVDDLLGFSQENADVMIYPAEIRERVRKIIYEQIRKYQYLFR